MDMRKLQPAREGLLVRHTTGRHLSPAGELVPFTNYWARRLADGDVVEVRDSKSTKKPKTEKS